MDEKKYDAGPTDLELAKMIYAMRYGQLKSVGRTLFEMTQKDEGPDCWPLTTDDNWSELLFTWAESVVSDNEAGD